MLHPCPDYGDIFYSYHGTSPNIAKQIASGNINISLGGGELGKGFYTGQYEHEAKAWAFHVSGTTKENVVRLVQFDVYDFLNFNIINLNIHQATQTRNNLKTEDKKRTYTFGSDIVTSKIVGSSTVTGCQIKWESKLSEQYLNSYKTEKIIIW